MTGLPPVSGSIAVVIPGKPVGKGRPKFGNGRTYTPADTVKAEREVRAAWQAAGAGRLPLGPVRLYLEAVVERPASHWKRDGTLSAAGERLPYPLTRPDLDNVVKLVSDALNDCAFKDDAHIVDSRQVRRWANPGEEAHVRVELWDVLAQNGKSGAQAA
ncbi:RusA family crossover junction endodeoxyribonuclease [Paraconexibacter antarcticus]|uniref:RusA family crossover junction endodeoxyribonuclease n=1 Tax=Paraconexibacter antarcticus TaxID=2949664 RepID=A0ABY5DYB5_9ACTN|nr:RusA family crossover junction endodeoxyribonuclease [Paraconexibacter antarcticus]UTI65637.1 RusA family crossover junction endodeoxyribonuclease [Paraconexibacter antarcticus]